jgi:hypothetical protein
VTSSSHIPPSTRIPRRTISHGLTTSSSPLPPARPVVIADGFRPAERRQHTNRAHVHLAVEPAGYIYATSLESGAEPERMLDRAIDHVRTGRVATARGLAQSVCTTRSCGNSRRRLLERATNTHGQPTEQSLRADTLTMIAFRGPRDPQEAATGSDTNPRSETLARHCNWSGGTSSRRLGKRWTSDPIATRPSSRASGAPRQ